MVTAMDRLNAKIEEARKAHSKACDKRDAAIKALTRAADNIVKASRTLARLEKRRVAAKAEARKASKTKDKTPIVV